MRGLGWDLDRHVKSGRLRLQQVDPAELTPGEFAHQVRAAVERDGTRVIVIDSLNGYLNAMPEERHLALQLHELLSYLAQLGVTTVMVMAQHGMMGAGMAAPVDVSYLADTVLLLRYFESEGAIRQAISVVKKRGGNHERTLREFRFGAHGIRVGPPLREFRGILTGVPVHTGNGDALLKTRMGSRLICPQGGNMFATGDAVVYHALSGSALGGLEDDHTYYVFEFSLAGFNIALRLADSYCHAVGAEPDPVTAGGIAQISIAITPTSNNGDLHSLARDLGGLEDGVTYYVRSISGQSIQARDSPDLNATPITLDATHRTGKRDFNHFFGAVQVDLYEHPLGEAGQQGRCTPTSRPACRLPQPRPAGRSSCQRLAAPGRVAAERLPAGGGRRLIRVPAQGRDGRRSATSPSRRPPSSARRA